MSRLVRVVGTTVLMVLGLVATEVPTASASTLQSGVVTTGDGTPLAGATVSVFDETGKGIAGSTTTDVNGAYTLEDCPSCVGQVVAAAEGYYSARGGPNYTLFARTQPFVGWATSTILTFGWPTVPGAAAYRVTLADEPTFKHPKIIFKATKNVHTFKQLLKTHTYYLQVYPVDADSHVIRPDIWLGDSNKPLAARTGYVNNLRAVDRTDTTLKFQWAPLYFASGHTRYELQLSSSPTFQGYRTRTRADGDVTLTFTDLTPGKAYYARIRGTSASGVYTSGWSGVRTVYTTD